MNKQPTTFKSIAIRIIALGLGLWLGAMMLATWAASEHFFRQIHKQVHTFTDCSPLEYDYGIPFPGHLESQLIDHTDHSQYLLNPKPLFHFMPGHYDRDNLDWLYWKLQPTLELPTGYDHSLIYFNGQGQVLMTSGNRFTCLYTDEAGWQDPNMEYHSALGYLWIDLDTIPGAIQVLDAYNEDFQHYVSDSVFRLTGWFEGNQFHPATVDTAEYSCDNCPWTKNYDGYCPDHYSPDFDIYREFYLKKQLQWNNLLSVPVDESHELVTVYGWYADDMLDDPQNSVTLNGKTYDTLTDLRLESGLSNGTVGNLWESVIFRTVTCSCKNSSDTYTYALTVRCRPIQYASLKLIPLYLETAIALALALLLILWLIKRNLTNPINNAILNNLPSKSPSRWAEPRELEQYLLDTRKTMKTVQAETARLNTALGYAKDAEERRKDMISNMGHELKTPLSMIQTHAKQLQTPASPEDQEGHIRSILEETNRMDTLVMQMLALSRLEAGRVKLNMESFSLRDMILYVAETLQPRMEEKALDLRLDLDDEIEMYGDPTQMERVIRYYMDNTLKITSHAGQIYVRSFLGKYGTYFYTTGTCPHLDEDALNRVYEPFCGEDTDQPQKGCDLSLAIARKILALHNYETYVINSTLDGQDAVEYGFHITA